jgi:hypothetical protein
MAAKPQKTLFEAMRTSKGRGVSRPVDRVERPAVVAGEPRVPVAPMSRGKRPLPWMSPRVALPVATAVVLALAALVIHQATKGRGSPTIAEAQSGGVQKSVLKETGPGTIRTGDRQTYNPNAVATDGGQAVQPPKEPVAEKPVAVSTGDWRVRICRSESRNKKDFDGAAKYLKDNGVETYQELRNGFYFLYSKQGFLLKTDPAAEKLLSRVKELGKAFPESSRTNTDFHDAYFLEKPVN